MLPFFALIQSIIKSSCCSLLKPCSESNHISLLLSPLCWFRPPPLAYSTLTASWSVSCLLSLFSFPPNNPFPTHQPGWKVKHFMLSFPLNRPQLCIILDIQAHLLMVTYTVPLVSAASPLASTTFPLSHQDGVCCPQGKHHVLYLLFHLPSSFLSKVFQQPILTHFSGL